MRILGMIGRSDEPLCHDAAAAIIEDGQIIVALEQERLSRNKHAPGEAAIDAVLSCLRQTNLTLDDIDYVAYGWLEDLAQPETKINDDIVASRELTELLLPPDRFAYTPPPLVYFVKHHRAHMAASYYVSGFDQAAGLIIDGQGEAESISLYQAQANDITLLASYGIEYSLGLFYETGGYYSGLGWDAAGKFMGLAAYGRPHYDIGFRFDADTGRLHLPEFIQRRLPSSPCGAHTITRLWIEYFETHFYPYVVGTKQEVMYYADFAASVQKTLEEIACGLAAYVKAQVPSPNLVLSGGVTLNCAMNSALSRSKHFENLYNFPASNDAGVSVGAALDLYHCLRPEPNHRAMVRSVSLGRTFDDREIEAAFCEDDLMPVRLAQPDLIEQASKDLADGLVVAWFQHGDEFGPRALGKRSLLASPTDRGNLAKLNRIKSRETWRPIAPSLLAEYVDTVLESPVSSDMDRFMLTVAPIAAAYRRRAPAVVHVDFTTRPQIVFRDEDPLYWSLIEAFRQKTGVPMVCNTSFNVDTEPIVHTPQDAVKVFLNSADIDTLVVGPYYISRRDGHGQTGGV